MRLSPLGLLAALLVFNVTIAWAADDDEATKAKALVEAQKKGVLDRWSGLEVGDSAPLLETPRFLIIAPKSYEKRMEALGGLMDRAFDKACTALKIDAVKDPPWSGKLAIYIVTERGHFTSFVRRVEARRLEDGEYGSYRIDRDHPHAIGGPPAMNDPTPEVQALQQMACALLQKKAGSRTPLPGWLVDGFGRATYYRVMANDPVVKGERLKTAKLVREKRSSIDLLNDRLEPAEAALIGASVVDYLAFAGGSTKFPEMVDKFKPEENMDRRLIGMVFADVGIKPEAMEMKWRGWALTAR